MSSNTEQWCEKEMERLRSCPYTHSDKDCEIAYNKLIDCEHKILWLQYTKEQTLLQQLTKKSKQI